jgi:hypothetical protein
MGKPSRVRVTGPLAPRAAGFRQELARQGYTPHSASNQLQLIGPFDVVWSMFTSRTQIE